MFVRDLLSNGANINGVMFGRSFDPNTHDTINSLIVLLKLDIHDDANKQIVNRCKFLNQNDTLNLLLDQGVNYDHIN